MEIEPVDGGEHERGSATVLPWGSRLGLGKGLQWGSAPMDLGSGCLCGSSVN
eukprot:IDg22880t1